MTREEMISQSKALMDHATTLSRRFATHTARITVVGQGHAGLPLAVEFAKTGFFVTGLDTDVDRVTALATGQSHAPDVPSEELQVLLRAGRYHVTTVPAGLVDSDAVIICVPAPVQKSKESDISCVVAAARNVATHFRPGQLIILESASYREAEELLLPLFQSNGVTVGEDVFLAFSPERIDPGSPTVTDIPKVVGGVTPACTRLAANLYREIVPRIYEISTPKVAELAKLYENWSAASTSRSPTSSRG